MSDTEHLSGKTPTLKIDDREPPQFAEKIAELCPVPIEICRLETGDYVCDDVVVERKTIDDFCLSIFDTRLWTQTKKMKEQFKHCYILTTDGFENLTINIHRHALLGALASVLKSGISVCFNIADEDDFVYLLLKIFEKHGKFRLSTKRPKLPKSL